MKGSTLRYWLHKIRASENLNTKEEGWILLPLDNSRSAVTTPIVIKIGTLSVEAQPGFDKSLLVDVITVVQSLC